MPFLDNNKEGDKITIVSSAALLGWSRPSITTTGIIKRENLFCFGNLHFGTDFYFSCCLKPNMYYQHLCWLRDIAYEVLNGQFIYGNVVQFRLPIHPSGLDSISTHEPLR